MPRKAVSHGCFKFCSVLASTTLFSLHIGNMDPDPQDLSSVAARRQHNAKQPIHTLPVELFLEALFYYVDDPEALEYRDTGYPTTRLHVLAQVCSHWFHSILTNPRFWRNIAFDEIDLIPTILHRNPSGPLIIDCERAFPAEDINEFLEKVCDHASRWDTLLFGDDADEIMMDMLRRPMPALKAVSLYTQWDEENYLVFPVSEAPALEFIKTQKIAMPWDSPSLSGLRYLSIGSMRENFPSLHQLVAILIASPALEWFVLRDLRADKDEVEEEESGLPDKILLPSLEGLVLAGEMPRVMRRYLASSIAAPMCHTLHTLIEFDTIERPGSTFKDLIHIPIHAPNFHIVVRYRNDGAIVSLISKAGAFDTGRPAFGSDGGGNEIGIQMGYDLDKWELLVQTLALPATALEIRLEGCPKDPQGHSLTKPEHFYFWTSATDIEFESTYTDVVTVLEFLRSPLVVDGEARWACPKLKEIDYYSREATLLDADAIGKLLTEVVEKRHLASSDAGHPGEGGYDYRPTPVKRLRAPSSILDIVRASPYAEGVDLISSH